MILSVATCLLVYVMPDILIAQPEGVTPIYLQVLGLVLHSVQSRVIATVTLASLMSYLISCFHIFLMHSCLRLVVLSSTLRVTFSSPKSY